MKLRELHPIILTYGHSTKTSRKAEIIRRNLYYKTGDVISMLSYSEGRTFKTYCYASLHGRLIGYAYLEHLPGGRHNNYQARGTMGTFINPRFRGRTIGTQLLLGLKSKLKSLSYHLPLIKISVDPKAYKFFSRVFKNLKKVKYK